MSKDVNGQLLAFFKALAHESRLRMLGLVAQREHSVQELAAAVGVSEPTASHHLAMLRELGLVSRRTEGTTHWYSFVPDAVSAMTREIMTADGVKRLASTPKPDRHSPEAIIANYTGPDGRLTHIPAQRKKRYAVLAWLVRQFEENRLYREAEINETLQRFHWDSATLRREFVMYNMMQRERGEYWRMPDLDWRAADGAAPQFY